jgi:hypothetical protein
VISADEYQWLASVDATEAWSFLWTNAHSQRKRPATAKLPPVFATLHPSQQQLLEEQLAFAMGSAKRKVIDPARWRWTQRLLEQASDEWTAAETANDFPMGQPVIDICSGAGVDTVALSRRMLGAAITSTEPLRSTDTPADLVVPVDASSIACSLTALNSRNNGFLVQPMESRFEDMTLREDVWLHMDPDRRADGHKHIQLQQMQPAWDSIATALYRCKGASIKIAPGFQTTQGFEWGACGPPDARRWLSRDGSVRQQRLYWRLPRWGSGKRIVSLQRSDGLWIHEQFSENEITGNEVFRHFDSGTWHAGSYEHGSTHFLDDDFTRLQLGNYVADQDPVLRAAQCSSALARRLGARVLGNEFGYFHAPSILEHPMLRWFRVHEILPLDRKKLKAYTRSVDTKRWELKSRNIDIDLVKLQRELITNKSASEVRWLLLTKIGPKHVAIAAEEVKG